jgi:cell division protein FtsI/penicillin-binding protein 2
LASAALYKTWQAYGIGKKTGIDLAGEVKGLVNAPADTVWQKIDLANASFGQGVAITPIQVMRAYCIMENGGTAVTPHVAMPISDSVASPDKSTTNQIISASLSSTLTGLMEHVVKAVPSYDQATYLPNYHLGGKTGTAQIWDPSLDHGKGGWKENIYNYSFFGWVGQDKPDFSIGVVIYEGTPTKIGQGILAMPVQSTALFRRIATDAVVTQKIPGSKNGPPAPSRRKTKSLG